MVDWSPFGGNPVPGDPGQVKVLAGAFHSFAQDVDEQNSLLKALKEDTTGVWEGPAADAFRPHLEDLPPKLDKLVRSYREAGDALTTYAPKLQTAQDEAVAALKKATEAMTRLGTAQANKARQDAANTAAAKAATPDHPAPTVIQPDYGAAVQQAQADLQNAHHAKDAAVADARRAADQCVSAIRHAADDGIKNKHHHWWDTVVDIVTHPVKLLKIISLVANTLSGILGICALLTCWIPGVGEFFEAAALVTGLIGMAADLALALMGDGSWTAVLTDAVAVGTAGVGHVLGEAADAGRVVAEGKTVLSEGEQTMERSAALKSEARTMLQTGKGGKFPSAAAKAQAAAKRLEAGELTVTGKGLVSEGEEAIAKGSNPLRYGAGQTADQAGIAVQRTGQRIGHTIAPKVFAAPEKLPSYLDQAKGALGPEGPGLRALAYDFVGYGDPATVFFRKASIGVNAYSTALTLEGVSGNNLHGVTPGTQFDEPGPWQEQLKEGLHEINPLVVSGLEPS